MPLYVHSCTLTSAGLLNPSHCLLWDPSNHFSLFSGQVYLWTSAQAKPGHDGNHDKTEMMKESVDSLVLFFRKYGAYPVIMFHDLPEYVRVLIALL